MARLFNDALSEYLQADSTPVTAVPLTFAAWARSNDDTANQAVLWVGDKDANDQMRRLQFAGAVASDPIRYLASSGGAAAVLCSTTAGFVANTWHHVACASATTSDHRVYLDGGNKGTGSNSTNPTGLDRVAIGRHAGTTPTVYFSGDIAEVAIWNAALNDAEVLSLSKGTCPLLVRPDALVAYWPIKGRLPMLANEPDHVGRYDMTITGSPAQSAHPRVLYFVPPQSPVAPAGALSYTLDASSGSFSFTGQGAGLKAARLVTGSSGAFTLTGQSASLLSARRLVAEEGVFAHTGQSANLLTSRKLVADAGGFIHTGQSANLLSARKISADAGSFTGIGQAAGLLSGRKVSADAGAFTYTGQAASLLTARKLDSSSASFTHTGQSAGLYASRVIGASGASFSFSGGDAGLLAGRKLVCASASFTETGQSADLLAARVLPTNVASFTFIGGAAGVLHGRKLFTDQGAYSLTGGSAYLGTTRLLLAGGASFSSTGQSVSLFAARRLAADSASYTFSDQDAALTYQRNTAGNFFRRFVLSRRG